MTKHVTHLIKIFEILIENEISINSKKTFIEYSSIQLLEQRVDSLNLFTDEEKLKAIAKLKFSRILKQLKTYLDLIEWMREYVLNYASVSQSLQDRKILLLKNSSIFDAVRRKFSFFTRLLNSTSIKKQTFNLIQSALFKPRRLVHVDVERQFYDDVDVSKEFDIDVMIYHVKDDEVAWPQSWVSDMSNNPTRFNPRVEQEFLSNSRVWTKIFVQTREICMWRARFHRVRAVQPKGWADEFARPAGRVWTFVRNPTLRPGYDEENLAFSIHVSTIYSSRSRIEFILFLSRQLKSAEKNYWSTKLKIAEIVFIIRKIRHMIESFKYSTILFTDHEFALRIVKQTNLLISSIDRLNLRLIRAFEYIQRFNLIIKHKSDKQHIVSDVLFRLVSENDDINISESEELNALFTTILIEMNSNFKFKIIFEYFTDSKWKKILQTLFENFTITLSFELNNDDLIYRIDKIVLEHVYESKRLCISSSTISDILNIAHEDSHHSRFATCFDIIFFSWYIHELIRHLRQYLRHCLECQIFQTRRHKSYDSLQSILTSDVSFHTLTMNFILALFVSISDKFDSIMFLTCKFSKRITLILDKIIWKAKDWAEELLSRLKIMNWKLSKAIIFDRDAKFLSKLWQIWFNKLEIKFLYSIAYHSQSNDQSERTNQTIEIAFRFHLCFMKISKQWSSCLSTIQSHMNNSTRSLDKTSNEIVYDFISIQSSDLTTSNSTTAIIATQVNQIRLRKKIFDFIVWSQLQMKQRYNRKHQSLFMKIDDFALLRLYKGYNILVTKILEKKLSDQYARSFKMIEKVENLAYRLQLSNHWRIHSIISVTQLESIADSSKDSYSRSRFEESDLIEMKDDTQNVKFFEIETLINKRIIAREIEYLLRWKDYESQWDEWRKLEELQNALDLIQNYETFMSNVIFLSSVAVGLGSDTFFQPDPTRRTRPKTQS
jgi:hypothetical protein